MANRHTLHKSKLQAFRAFLETKGFKAEPTKGVFEVLRANDGKRNVIVYMKTEATEHLTVQDKDHDLLVQFIRENKRKGEQQHGTNEQQLNESGK